MTEWSEAIYSEFKDLPLALNGVWKRWEPNYLALKISSYLDTVVEPVVIDTCEDELTVSFGFWEIHLPDDGIFEDSDSSRAAIAAQSLVLNWLNGRIATAIYFDMNDNWCGSKLVETSADVAGLAETAWIDFMAPSRVEIRTRYRSAWMSFPLPEPDLTTAVNRLLKL